MLDRKKCVLHLSGENLLAESIWMAGVKWIGQRRFEERQSTHPGTMVEPAASLPFWKLSAGNP